MERLMKKIQLQSWGKVLVEDGRWLIDDRLRNDYEGCLRCIVFLGIQRE